MKNPVSWVVDLQPYSNDFEPESWVELKGKDLYEVIVAVQKDAWESAIKSAAEMCGGDSHIEQGVLSLIKTPIDGHIQ